MKRTAVAMAFLVLMVPACGGGPEDDGDSSGDTGVLEAPDSTETASMQEQDTGQEPAAPEPLYPEGKLDPAEVTADTPVGAAALYEAFFAWDGLEVTLQGYPGIFYGDSMTIEDEVALVGTPGGDQELATFAFDSVQGVPVGGDRLLTVRGTVDYYWTGDLMLTGASLVQGAEEAAPGTATSPYACNGTTPIPVAEFHELFNTWIGRRVVVEGYYHSTTTSTTDYGVTVRVDLAGSGDIYTKYVACEMTGAIPETSDSAMVASRDGVRIRGTIAGESFGLVGLEDCVLVNR
ncbi:MAG: hypothetical protein AVO35_06660 [Candidatus Aegiribacteria sp. MLS_C]|nr:MAG: hypothetical protein AVO35_06660 [Candidatus Aegiribacteria sp. MLS_C]